MLGRLRTQLAVPDLVVYLVANLETCMKRIRKRDRSFEKEISDEYMTELIDAYNHYYHYYNRSPLLVVDTHDLNFLEREEDFEDLIRQISEPIKGTHYYVPRGR